MTYRDFARFSAVSAIALAMAGLAACDGKSSAVAGRDSGAGAALAATGGARGGGDPRDLPVPRVNGKPMWAANRQHTAEENARYQFNRNGADFGADSETDYVAKAHAFVDRPPHGAETVDRPNGDRLIYDPKANVFAVVARTGAPRTMFKPRDGAAYWTEQKNRPTGQARRGRGGQDGGSDQG